MNTNIKKTKNCGKVYCTIMNIVDFRYWFCDCEYVTPYGLTINTQCKNHD